MQMYKKGSADNGKKHKWITQPQIVEALNSAFLSAFKVEIARKMLLNIVKV